MYRGMTRYDPPNNHQMNGTKLTPLWVPKVHPLVSPLSVVIFIRFWYLPGRLAPLNDVSWWKIFNWVAVSLSSVRTKKKTINRFPQRTWNPKKKKKNCFPNHADQFSQHEIMHFWYFEAQGTCGWVTTTGTMFAPCLAGWTSIPIRIVELQDHGIDRVLTPFYWLVQIATLNFYIIPSLFTNNQPSLFGLVYIHIYI